MQLREKESSQQDVVEYLVSTGKRKNKIWSIHCIIYRQIVVYTILFHLYKSRKCKFNYNNPKQINHCLGRG